MPAHKLKPNNLGGLSGFSSKCRGAAAGRQAGDGSSQIKRQINASDLLAWLARQGLGGKSWQNQSK